MPEIVVGLIAFGLPTLLMIVGVWIAYRNRLGRHKEHVSDHWIREHIREDR